MLLSNWMVLICESRYMTKYQSQYGAGGTQYSYYYEEDDSTFQLVKTRKSHL